MGIKKPALATLPAYFISFGLLGLWHGRTWPFIICGLMLAAGSSANHLYRSILGSRMPKETYKRLGQNPWYQSCCAALTFFYIALAITGLWLPGDAFSKTWHAFNPLQAVLSFGLITAALSAILYCLRICHPMAFLKQPAAALHLFSVSETPRAMGFKVFLILVWFFSFSANLPDFVYKGF